MFEALELILTVLLLSPSLCIGQEGCEYLFVQQPLAQLHCNPWPYIQQRGYLSLHCDITGPQTNDSQAPNVAWFMHRRDRVQAMSNETRIYLGTMKTSGPTSSADKLNGMKRVNFTLRINNVTSADIGCYWCRIKLQRSNGCSLIQSNTFCLFAVEFYANLSACTELPGNGTPVCGGNSSCVQATNDATAVSKSSTLASQTVVQAMLLPATTTSVHSKAPSPLTIFSLVHLRSSTPDPSTAMISTLHPEQTATISYYSESETGSESRNSGAITAREDAERIGLYVGTALCFVLLAIILVMVVGVILLWRRKPTKPQERRRALEGTSGTPSVADTWLPGEERTRETSAPRNDDSISGVQPSPSCNAQSLDLRDSRASGTPSSADSEQGPLYSCNRLSLTATQSNEDSRSSKTEVHYYHVLERPKYYNCPIMSEESEILDDFGLPNPMRLSWQSISSVGMEDLSDLQLLPVSKGPGEPCTGTSFRLNPNGQGGGMLHIYKELDQSTIEPVREYTKLIVTK